MLAEKKNKVSATASIGGAIQTLEGNISTVSFLSFPFGVVKCNLKLISLMYMHAKLTCLLVLNVNEYPHANETKSRNFLL